MDRAEVQQVQALIDAALKVHVYEQHKHRGNAFKSPTIDEVVAYGREQGFIFDGKAWCGHYESNGWMVGKVRMKDWRAGVRNAIRRGWCVVGRLEGPKLCSCGCGKPATIQRENRWWSSCDCYYKVNA